MRVIAYDPYVGEARYRELGVEKAESPDDVYAAADFLTVHLPKTPDTEGWMNAEVFAKCKDGVRVLNVARGPLVVDEDLQAALDSGKVGGAALDVFRSEPVTEHPLFHYKNVIVTPHLGASTAEATDRAGFQAAEQVVAALDRRRRHQRGQRAGDLGRGPGGARPLRAALLSAGADRDRAGRRRGRVGGSHPVRLLRPSGRARHPAAGDRGAPRRALGSHRGGGQRRQRPVDRRGAGDPRGRGQAFRRPRLHRSGARRGDRRREHGPGRRHADRPPQPAASDRGVGPAVRRPAGAAHHPVPLSRPAGHARPRRHPVRRARRQHRLGRGRPPARGGSQRRRAPGRDGDHHGLAGPARGRRRRSSPATGSSPVRPSR